ncbi:uroporphyrinogen-III synthase [Parasulfitobacter algicola]|uniref:Uroporphyrinogen-III synthase n=1 Tax=Parasulfitobacter algicola TaxID=2614809 RepID=A0ABX2IQD2_9RHOB|nr:uroporphyrinogen-III synthase [Sulfitobacter algicola]NSX55077.1 uroporphyrinogen-III synthase [Sulfitobacter algicola]
MNIQSQPTVLLTRPAAKSLDFAARIRAGRADVTVIIAPLIQIEYCDLPADALGYDALVFTSTNGVLAYQNANAPAHKIAFCVGDQTATAARDAGLQAISAHGDVDQLFDLICKDAPSQPLLHIRGEHSTGDLAQRLNQRGFQTYDVIAYRQIEILLSQDANAVLQRPGQVIAPLFSPRTADIFAPYAKDAKASLDCVAISENVKQAATDFWTKSSRVASRPDAQSMLDAIFEII